MFEDWDTYYVIIGSAAGALIGLMFVVATLSAGLNSRLVERGMRIYYSPIVFDFAIVMIVSAIASVPKLPLIVTLALLAACAVVGFAYSIATWVRVVSPPPDGAPPVHWTDKWLYGIVPAAGYFVLATAVGAGAVYPDVAVFFIGAAMLFVLLVGIRNAWDLAQFLVQRPFEKKPPG